MKNQTISQNSAPSSTILIVDDNPDIRLLLSLTLAPKYTLLEAADGFSALQMIARQRPRIVLLDIMMPGELDGLQVLDAIKGDEQLKDILVGIVSARSQNADSAAARMQGADAYFVKPFSPRDIKTWIESQLP